MILHIYFVILLSSRLRDCDFQKAKHVIFLHYFIILYRVRLPGAGFELATSIMLEYCYL